MLDSASGLASLTEVGSFPGCMLFTLMGTVLVPNETPSPSLTAVDFLGWCPRFFLSFVVPVLVSAMTRTSSEVTEGGDRIGGSEADCGGDGGSGSSGAG
jgi:hypothetical protein